MNGAVSPPALGRNEVHVWTADLDVSSERASQLSGLLAVDELSRAGRLRDARDRDRAVASRGILRRLVAGYVGEAPARVSITSGRNGKPKLDRQTWLGFSVSHAGGRALYAFARDREVGVDIERIVSVRATAAVAEHFFSPRERSALSKLSPEKRARAFFTCWSRKEALVKATGEGMAAALESIEVYPTSGVKGWHVVDIAVGHLYAAAVAVAGGPVRVSGVFAALPPGEGPAAGARAEERVVEAARSELERETDVPSRDSFAA